MTSTSTGPGAVNPALAGQSNDPSFENIWQELRWRGLVHVSTDEAALEELLAGDPITYYLSLIHI